MQIVMALAFVAAAAWLLRELVAAFSEGELRYWDALGILFLPAIGRRLMSWAWPDMDLLPRVGLGLALYLGIMTAGLVLCAKVPPVRAVLISVTMAVVLTVTVVAMYATGVLRV